MAFKKKYSQAARVQGIIRTLGARQGITIGELAEEFGVTKRTFCRDLRALAGANKKRYQQSIGLANSYCCQTGGKSGLPRRDNSQKDSQEIRYGNFGFSVRQK